MGPVLAQSGVSPNSGITVGAPKNPTTDAPTDAAYGVVVPNSSLPNARTLTGSTNIGVTDGGAGGAVTFAVQSQIPVANGGTGASTQQGAANAVLNFPGLTSQDLFYYNGTNIARFPKGSSSTFLSTNGSGNIEWAGSPSGIASTAPVLMFGTDGSASASRAVTAGTGISITDGGPMGNATFAIDSTVATLTGTQVLTNKTLTAPTMGWNSGSGFNLAGSTFNSALKWADWAAARNLTIPDPGADASFVLTEGAQTLNGVKTFGSTPVLSTGAFTVGGNTVTVPSATDTLVNLASTQSLSNKTISAPVFTTGYDLKTGSFALQHTWDAPAANRAYVIKDVGGAAHYVMKDTTSAYTAGAIPYGDGSKLVVGSAGTSGQPLLSGGTGAYTFGTLGPTVGGTNQTTYATGDMLYATGANTLGKLNIGTNGYVMTVAGGVPTWAAASGSTLTLNSLPFMTAGAGSLTASATTGDTIYGSGSNAYSKLGIGSSGQVLTVASGIPAWKAGPIVNNLRLTLSSSNPDTDTSAASTIYALPYNGNSISIYNGSTWDSLTTSSASIAVPATQYFRLYNVYCYNSASTPTLELDAWDSGGQTTKTITAATAANPCVITTSTTHGLSVGNLIGIRKGTGTGTGWTDTAMGLDQKVFRVSAVPTTTTIELEGCDASALTFSTFTGTPTVYKIPTSPTTAPVRQDGVWCKTGTLTRRFLGTFMTNGAGTVDDSTSARLVSNVDNRAPAILSSEDTTSSYTTASTSTFYPRTNSIALGITRVYMVNALTKPVPLHVTNASNGTTDGFAISRNNCTPATLANWPSSFLGAASSGYYNYSSSFDVNPSVPAGFSFFQQFNYGNGSAYYGSANATDTSMCRITAEVER